MQVSWIIATGFQEQNVHNQLLGLRLHDYPTVECMSLYRDVLSCPVQHAGRQQVGPSCILGRHSLWHTLAWRMRLLEYNQAPPISVLHGTGAIVTPDGDGILIDKHRPGGRHSYDKNGLLLFHFAEQGDFVFVSCSALPPRSFVPHHRWYSTLLFLVAPPTPLHLVHTTFIDIIILHYSTL